MSKKGGLLLIGTHEGVRGQLRKEEQVLAEFTGLVNDNSKQSQQRRRA